MPPRRDALVAAMDDAIQEGAGRQDDRPSPNRLSAASHDADDPVAFKDKPLGRPRHQGQIGRPLQFGLHGLAIEAAVDLAAWAPNGGALGSVQEAELDA